MHSLFLSSLSSNQAGCLLDANIGGKVETLNMDQVFPVCYTYLVESHVDFLSLIIHLASARETLDHFSGELNKETFTRELLGMHSLLQKITETSE